MSAQKRKNFKEKIGGAYVIICHETLEIQNNFVILHRRSRRMTICLFHGVMVSTRVFGSLSPRSSRSGTTSQEKEVLRAKTRNLFPVLRLGHDKLIVLHKLNRLFFAPDEDKCLLLQKENSFFSTNL